ncbi:predicted protein [Cyanophage PSS2]|uniref:hypothetical protein n=1 Tax=Cyanophage PSS2 TaxID=658401 RepID=UPI0001B04001|nr:hypothetical protein PSS2_gp044 [Cyanophage PSS2]ACT65606.1 hypothetical protein [Cyanophage PSS2]ACY75749.1 predicted protein [Cyanophage PSS2]
MKKFWAAEVKETEEANEVLDFVIIEAETDEDAWRQACQQIWVNDRAIGHMWQMPGQS